MKELDLLKKAEKIYYNWIVTKEGKQSNLTDCRKRYQYIVKILKEGKNV